MEVVFKRRGYDPDQPRWPKGSGDKAGEWRDTLGGVEFRVGLPDDSRSNYFHHRGSARAGSYGAEQISREVEAAETIDKIAESIRKYAPYSLESRWNGTTNLPSSLGFHAAAAKELDCTISMRADYYSDKARRFSSLPHEWLHSVSPLRDIWDYMTLTGWEEGIVEALTRELRPRILRDLGEDPKLDNRARIIRDAGHPYGDFVEFFKEIASVVEMDYEPFLWQAIRQPLHERHTWVYNKGEAIYRGDRELMGVWDEFYGELHRGLTTGGRPPGGGFYV